MYERLQIEKRWDKMMEFMDCFYNDKIKWYKNGFFCVNFDGFSFNIRI